MTTAIANAIAAELPRLLTKHRLMIITLDDHGGVIGDQRATLAALRAVADDLAHVVDGDILCDACSSAGVSITHRPPACSR